MSRADIEEFRAFIEQREYMLSDLMRLSMYQIVRYWELKEQGGKQ